jgi:hypothetical protein
MIPETYHRKKKKKKKGDISKIKMSGTKEKIHIISCSPIALEVSG